MLLVLDVLLKSDHIVVGLPLLLLKRLKIISTVSILGLIKYIHHYLSQDYIIDYTLKANKL